MDLFDLFAKVTLDDSNFKEGVKGAGESGEGLKTKLSGVFSAIGTAATTAFSTVQSVGQTALSVIGGIAGIGATAVVALGKVGFDYNTQMETYTTNFTTMMGSASKAASKVEELKTMAAKTPFELGGLAKATQTLLAFNVPADKSTDVLQKLGDISLGNSEKLGSLTSAYGKMSSSQKVTLEQLQVMIEAGFNPLLLISQKTGESMGDLYDRVSKGGVSFDELSGAIDTATSAGGQFYEGMQSASTTITGLYSTLVDNFKSLAGDVFTPITDSVKSDLLPTFIDAVGQLQTAFDTNGIQGLITAAGSMVGKVIAKITEKAPEFIDMGFKIVNSLIDGVSKNLDSVSTAGDMIIDRLKDNLTNTADKMLDAASKIIDLLAAGFVAYEQTVIDIGLKVISKIAQGVYDNIGLLVDGAQSIIDKFVEPLESEDNLASIYEKGTAILKKVVDGIAETLPEITTVAFNTIVYFAEALAKEDTLAYIVAKGYDIITAIITGVSDNAGNLVSAAIDILLNLGKFITDPKNLLELLTAVGSLVSSIADGIAKKAPDVATAIPVILDNIRTAFFSKEGLEKLDKIGADILEIIFTITSALLTVLFNYSNKAVNTVSDYLTSTDNKKKMEDAGTLMGGIFGSAIMAKIGKAIYEGVIQPLQGIAINSAQLVEDIIGEDAAKKLLGTTAGELQAGADAYDKSKATENNNAANQGTGNTTIYDGSTPPGVGNPNVNITQNIYGAEQSPSDIADAAANAYYKAVLGGANYVAP